MVVCLFTDVTDTASGTTANVLWNTLELVEALLTTTENSALLLEVAHGHGWKSSSLVVCSSVVVDLMDGNGGVDNIGLDNLSLDYWLDCLVDVVVNMLSSNSGCSTLALCGSIDTPLIAELSLFLRQVLLGGFVVTVVKLAVLDSTELGSVLLWKDLTVLDWLDGAVVVVLVNLLVDSSVDLLVLVGLDDLLGDCRGNCLVDSGVMVA